MIKAGAIIDARFFKSVAGISLSQALALWTSKLESKVETPSMVISICGIYNSYPGGHLILGKIVWRDRISYITINDWL